MPAAVLTRPGGPLILPDPLPPVFLAERALDRYLADPAASFQRLDDALAAHEARARAEARDEDEGRLFLLRTQAAQVHARRQSAATRVALGQKAAPAPDDSVTAWYAAMLGESPPYTPPARVPRPAAPTGPTPQQVALQARTRAPVPTAPYTLDALTDPPAPPQLIVVVPDHAAALRQLWRHVANRACLAILADARLPTGSPSLTVPHTTTPPDGPPRVLPGGDVFRVRVDPLGIAVAGRIITTPRLDIDLPVRPEGEGAQVTLRTLRGWPAPKTPDPLFRYWAVRRQLVRRDGLSGDVVALFETLLAPYARTLLDALDS
ncbi:hypothetical protein [uncultured Deinococcus sp.]|uniref:hypothetical protein n=1 Tax=uncultured Deinococcus sp. TaxID=158789 RepID=UPI00374A242E